MQACILGDQQLAENPDTLGLASLKPIIDYVIVSKTEIVSLKNYLEILMFFICAPAVLLGKAAMIFPILYFQYIRIKYVSSSFHKETFKIISGWQRQYLPGLIYESTVYQAMLNHLYSYVVFPGDESKKKEAAPEEKPETFPAPAPNQGNQGGQRVPMGSARANAPGAGNDSQRVFATMMMNNNFRFPNGYTPNTSGPTVEELEPTVEEVGEEDLD